jgi:predicted ATPase/class 3 adenylate cyclase
VHFEVLGPFGIRGSNGLIELRGDKRRGLVAFLVVNHGHVCLVDRIVEALWEGEASPGATGTVRTYVSQLRKDFDAGTRVATRAGGYVLELGDDAIDAERFERLIELALVETDVARRLELLDGALELWRGPPLSEFAGSAWADEPARRWERLHLVAIERRVSALLDLGRHVEALPELERALAAEPLHEHLWAQLALARYRCGHQADALAALRSARRALGEELGVDPGPELVELERQILDHDAALQWSPARAPAATTGPASTGEDTGLAPTGTVTFLVTDVEQSSHLWEENATAMAIALARHDEIVSTAVRTNGGTIFKQLGDGLLAAFSRTSAAVAAAVDAQGALVEEQWGLDSPLRVRMALHAGEAVVERGGDYFGPVLNRCSRLVTLANGGQVLVSGTVADALRDHPVPGVTLRGLGEHRLRDLLQPERVAQVLHKTLPSDFPTLRLIDALPGNLPVQLTSFVGRDGELKRLVECVAEQPITTLTGVGGVGKTRLALQTAAELGDRFSDGAWFVEIAAINDSALVPNAVASALGIPRADGEDASDALVGYLAHRNLLLVIDNCEQVIEGAAALVARLSRAGASVHVLATSRQPLEVAGEQVVPISPLPVAADAELLSAAEMLFVLRAKAAAPAFEITDANAAAVRRLCTRLEGIPLAIELAAARVRSLSPEALLSRLDDRFRLLRGSRRDQSERHQTLRAAVEWSYDLLDADERELFARLAVFRGGFDLEALEEIADDIDADPLDLLDRLVSRSLVVAETAVRNRFRILETLRDYGAERLETSGGRAAIEEWHAHYYLRRAPALATSQSPDDENARRVDRDLDNLRVALAWHVEREPEPAARAVLALWRYLVSRSLVVEAQQWLETLVGRVDDGDTILRARLLERLGDACLLSGAHADDGIVWLGRALQLYQEHGDTLRAARVHIRLARNLSAYPAVMDIERALEHAVKADAILVAHDNERLHAEVRAMHASIALYGRRNRAGAEAAREAEAQAARIGAQELRLHALAAHGAHLGYCGDIEHGFALLEQAWTEADLSGDAFVTFLAAWMRGFAAWLLHDPVNAMWWWSRERTQPRTESAPLQHRTLDSMLCLAQLRLGRIEPALAIRDDDIVNAPELRPHLAMCQGDWDHAARLITSARAVTLRQGNRNEWTQLTLLHARLRARLNDADGTARLAGEALATLEDGECPYYEIPARALLAGAQVDAAENIEKCRALMEAQDYRGLVGAVALAEVRAAVAADDEAAAHDAFTRAQETFQRYQLRFDEVELLATWGAALGAWGSEADGRAHVDTARQMLGEMGTPRWGALLPGGVT